MQIFMIDSKCFPVVFNVSPKGTEVGCHIKIAFPQATSSSYLWQKSVFLHLKKSVSSSLSTRQEGLSPKSLPEANLKNAN